EVEQHQGLTLVVLSSSQADASYICKKGVAVWSLGLDKKGEPIARSGRKKLLIVDVNGKVKAPVAAPARKPAAPKLNEWEYLSTSSFLDGTSKEYKLINKPISHDKAGHNFGYGWYRIPIAKTGTSRIISPGAKDRIHIYHQSKLKRIAGEGPGAVEAPVTFSANGQIVALTDNLGRFNY